MKNSILSFLVLAGSALSSFAQTTLQAGDIAFVGIQSGESGQAAAKDRYAFVLLKSINANTQIIFTDNSVINPSPVRFCKNEGFAKWTSNINLAVGTVITLSEDSTASGGSVIGGLGLSQSGDQVIAFQVNGLDTTVLAGITTTGWESICNTVCSGPANNSKSCLPTNLVNGTNALGFPNERNNAFFNLDDISGTPAEILAAIHNPANWTREDVLQIWPVWSFSVVTSIKNLKSNTSVNLSPSISDGTFTVENNSGAPLQLSIHNLLGQTQILDVLPVGKKEFSFPALPKGIYFAKTKDQAGKQTVTRFQISK